MFIGAAVRGADLAQLERCWRRFGELVVDPGQWPAMMEEICLAVGATGAALLQSDVRTPDVPSTESLRELLDHYFRDGWHKRDLRARGAPLLMRGEAVITDQDLVTPEQMRREPYYNECVRPFGYEWFAGIGFWAGSAHWALSLQRSAEQGPFEQYEKKMLALLSDRLTSVASLSTAVGRTVLNGVTNALGAVGRPAIAIDRYGIVLETNSAAEAVFDETFCVIQRRLFFVDKLALKQLASLLDQIRAMPDNDPLVSEPIVIRREGRAPVVMTALAVPPPARTPFLGAKALLVFNVIEARPGPNPALLARAFGLTRGEAAAASIFAEGRSPEDVAKELGVARETARKYLTAVFSKTATHRQSELVALLSRLS